jgi:tetratricopeptide (TPR) repeat protein
MLEENPSALAQATEAVRLRRLHHHNDETLANVLYYEARALMGLNRWREAVDAYSESLAIREKLHGDNHLLTATVRGEMAWGLVQLGRTAEAEQCARLATDYWRTLPDQTLLLGGPRSLAFVLHRTKRFEESVAIKREELAALQKAYGPEHPAIVGTLDNLGYGLLDLNRDDEAEPILLEAVRQSRKFYPAYDHGRAHMYESLLRIDARRNDWGGQLARAREYVATSQRGASPDQRELRMAYATLGHTLLEQAEHFAETDSARVLACLDELTTSKDFAPEVKAAGGWVDCLRGIVLGRDDTRRAEARELLSRGLGAMKRKEKQTALETQRMKKAEAALARM